MSDLERVVTPVPGPRSRELARRLRAVESRGVTFLGDDFPVFWERADGATITDADGNRFLDLTSAFGVALTGHANPRVAEAIAAQAALLGHGMGDVHPTELKTRLLERLAAMAPLQDARGFLCSSGAEAVEFALKTALLATGRPNALAFEGSYHGLTHGALEVTGIARFRAPFLAQLRNANAFVAYPASVEGGDAALEAVNAALRDDPSIGAVIVEPIQGRAGVVVPPDGFLGGLRMQCDASGALLIVDEILTGFGRTGAMFAVEREAVVAGPALPGQGARGRLSVVGRRRHGRGDGRLAALGGGGAAHLDVPRQPDGLCRRAREPGRDRTRRRAGPSARGAPASGLPRASLRCAKAERSQGCAGAERYGASSARAGRPPVPRPCARCTPASSCCSRASTARCSRSRRR